MPVEKPDVARPKLRPEDRESLQREISTKTALLGATENSGGVMEYSPVAPAESPINKDRLRAEVKRLQGIIDSETPQRVSDPAKRQQIVNRRKWLQEKFEPFLETKRDLGAIRMDSPEYKEAFQKALQRPQVEHYIQEWQELGMMLEPDDPSINDLDKLRKAS